MTDGNTLEDSVEGGADYSDVTLKDLFRNDRENEVPRLYFVESRVFLLSKSHSF